MKSLLQRICAASLKRTCFLPLLISQACPLFFTQPLGQEKKFFIDHYTTKAGLSYNVCNDVIKDKHGLVWIATENGLNRFDGKNFKVYYHNPYDTTTPAGNVGYSLFEDQNGRIWYCSFSSGMNCYDPVTDKFRRYPPPPPGKTGTYQSDAIVVAETSEGKLWMAGERGLSYFDTSGKKIKLVSFQGQSQAINPSTIKTILEDSKKNLWIGTHTGAYRVDFLQKKLLHLGGDAYTSRLACDMKEDGQGNIWIAYWNGGLKRYNPDTKELKTFWADSVMKTGNGNNVFTSICFQQVDNRNIVWASSAGNLLYELDMDTEQLTQHDMQQYFPAYPQSVFLRKVYTDASNTLWLATTYGVIKIDPRKQLFRTVSLPAYSPAKWYTGITAVYADPADATGNTLWLAVTDEGILKYNLLTGSQATQKLLKQRTSTPFSVYQIGRGPRNDLWITTVKGLIQYNEEKNKYTFVPFDYPITCFWFDGKNTIWLGTSNGIYMYYVSKNRFSKLPEPVAQVALSQGINSMAVDKRGHLWFVRGYSVGKSAALSQINPNTLEEIVYYQHPQSDPGFPFRDDAYTIFCDSLNQVWVGTFSGLVVFNPTATKRHYELLAPFNGLPSNQVSHILQQDSLIWVNGHNGVSVVDMYSHRVLTTYTEAQGLFSNDMTVMEQGAGGNIFFADKLTLQYINANRIPAKPSPVQVYITNVKVLNKENVAADTASLFLKHLNLTYRQNAIEFEFTAPDFINPDEITYAYQLEGLDADWNYNSSAHASYNNLNGGNYVFKVKAGNSNGDWSNNITVFTFHVDAPWWKTGWFYTLCAMLVFAVLYSIYYIRVSRLKALLKLRNRIAGDLHDDIGSTLSSIHIMSAVAKQKAPQSAVLLDKIGSDAQLMQESMSDIVWAINPRNDRFTNVLQRMKIFASETLEASNIELLFHADEALYNVKLNMNQRKDLYFIFKEAVTNLVKYSACKNVVIQITLHNKIVKLLVQDDGRGFDMSCPTMGGNGLYNMQKRAKDLKGSLVIDSAKGIGTTIAIQFKIT